MKGTREQGRGSRGLVAIAMTTSLALVIAVLIGLGHASIGRADASTAEYQYAPTGYEQTTLGTLGGCCSNAYGINARGQIVGQSNTTSNPASPWHAFLWEQGVITDLGTLGGNSSGASDINNSGQIVGWSSPGGGIYSRATLWDHGTIVDLGTLGGSSSVAISISEDGDVAGYSDTSAGETHAFVWRKGVMTDLGEGQALAINARGQVVGVTLESGSSEAVLWENGAVLDLGAGQANGINARGQSVGWHPVPPHGEWSACVWKDGTTVDLGTLGGSSSEAEDINARGDVVGASFTAGGRHHAAVWKNGQVTDLGIASWWHSGANAINDRGQIVGYMVNVATLWNPTP